jgi:hypothetical protein
LSVVTNSSGKKRLYWINTDWKLHQKLTLKNNIINFSTKNLEKCVADDKYQNDDNQTLSRI